MFLRPLRWDSLREQVRTMYSLSGSEGADQRQVLGLNDGPGRGLAPNVPMYGRRGWTGCGRACL